MQHITDPNPIAVIPRNNSKITASVAKLQVKELTAKEVVKKLESSAQDKSGQIALSKTGARYQERGQTAPDQPPTNILAWTLGITLAFLAAIFLYIPVRNKLASWKRHRESKKFWENERKDDGSTHSQDGE